MPTSLTEPPLPADQGSRSVGAAVDASVSALPPEEQESLHSLAVRRGPELDRIVEILARDVPELAVITSRIVAIATPLASMKRVAQAVPETTDCIPSLQISLVDLLVHLSGSLVVESGWVMTPDAKTVHNEVDSAILACSSTDSLSSVYMISDRLNLPAAELTQFVLEKGHTVKDGHVVHKDLSTPDAVAAMFSLRGTPASIADIERDVFPCKSQSSIRNALVTDSRFIKSDKNSWALTKWGAAPYIPIHRQIAAIVDRRGSIGVDQLVDEITRSYDVKEHSVRTYAGTGDFMTHDDVVTRRKQQYVPRKSPSKTRHLYRDGSTVRWRTTIGSIHRKGSAFNLPSAVAALIGVGPGAPREFTSRLGPQSAIWVSVQARSGTIKRFVEDMDLRDGEDVFLEFTDGHFDIRRIGSLSSNPAKSMMQLIGRTPPRRVNTRTALDAVGDALWIESPSSAQEIADVLRQRRESELLAFVTSAI